MVDVDFSFIRLRDNLGDAHNTGDSPANTHRYVGQVQLLPFNKTPYLQITNVPGGIELEDIQVFAVDCAGNETEISDAFYFLPFTAHNGSAQLVIEIIDIPFDFGNTPVYLKFVQALEKEYYSNWILITDNEKNLTSRFDYKNTSNFWGISYEIADYYQSIQLRCYFDDYVSKDELDTYYQISRNQNVNTRALVADINQYRFEFLDGWTAKRLKRALYGDYCYINSVRSYPDEALEKEARAGLSNISENTFTVDPDETDIFTPTYQLYEGLQVVNLEPDNGAKFTQSQASSVTELVITFNQDIEKLNVNGSFIRPDGTTSIVDGNTTVNGNQLIVNISGLVGPSGEYVTNIINGSVRGLNLGEVWTGISNWTFEVVVTDYSAADYNPADYLAG